MDVHTGDAFLHRPRDVEVRRPGQVRVDAALHADLDRADVPRLCRPVRDLVQGERVRVGVGAALGEGAETAAGVADVGEVDVPRDDVRDVVPDHVPPQRVGDPAQFVQGGAVRVEQGEGLVVGELRRVVGGLAKRLAYVGVDAGGDHAGGGRLAERLPVPVHHVEVVAAVAGAALGVDGGVQVGAAGGGEALVRLLPGQAGGDRAFAGEARLRVGQGADVREEPGIEPGLAALDELRVDGEPFAELEARFRRPAGQFVDVRPGALGVHVVGGERGDAAPVVDARADEERVLGVHQVRRGLDAGGRPEDVPGHRDGGGQLLQFGVGHPAHRRVRLGAEVLHDDFLDAVVGAGSLPQLEEGIGTLLVGLPDPDQDAGGERHVGTSRVLQHAQPHGRLLVR